MTAPINDKHKNENGSDVSRRDFLWRLGIAGAGLTALAVAADAAPPSADNAGTASAPSASFRARSAPAGQVRQRSMAGGPVDARIHVNQAGYLPDEPKRAVISAMDAIPGNDFCLVDDDVTRRVRFRGELKEYRSVRPGAYGHYARHFYADF